MHPVNLLKNRIILIFLLLFILPLYGIFIIYLIYPPGISDVINLELMIYSATIPITLIILFRKNFEYILFFLLLLFSVLEIYFSNTYVLSLYNSMAIAFNSFFYFRSVIFSIFFVEFISGFIVSIVFVFNKNFRFRKSYKRFITRGGIGLLLYLGVVMTMKFFGIPDTYYPGI